MDLDGGVPRGIHVGVGRNVTRAVSSVFDIEVTRRMEGGDV
jgi:hypothetical protein